ncbi:hypothetical protein [Anthocerotibacter panamensis]|uniref:hypothetical protein n=1 Tax=Anthocerotibacter panamensis TaxID=2857077 RepID=UPI001C401951|nr:hypothetical protein [Anthocerotibacter panamensis]
MSTRAPAYGAPVRSIFASRAQGLNGQPVVVVKVWPGYGTNLNLIPTDELIKKAWIDDPSRVVLDFDSPLCPGSAGSGGGGNCVGGASVVHLRQIKGLKFPGLPTAPDTLLTLVTEGSKGRKLYQFRIVPTKGKPEYHTLTLLPDTQGTPFIELSGLRRGTVEDVQRGLGVARSRKLLSPKDALWLKTQNFILAVRNGESVNGAAQAAGVSMSLVNHLTELGLEAALAPPVSPTSFSPPPTNQPASTTRPPQ